MATPKAPSQYPVEYISAVHAARSTGEFKWPCSSKGVALNQQRHLYTWAKACRDHPEDAPPGAASLVSDVEFIIRCDLEMQWWVCVRRKANNPTALAIRKALNEAEAGAVEQPQPEGSEIEESAKRLAEQLSSIKKEDA